MFVLIHSAYPRHKAVEVGEVFQRQRGTGKFVKELSVVTRMDVRYGIEAHSILEIEAGKEFEGLKELLRTMQEYNIEGYSWQMDVVTTPEELAAGVWR